MDDERTGPPDADALYEGAACALVLTTADGLIRRANSIFYQWIGWAEEDLVDRRRIQDLFTVGGRIFHQTHWAPLIKMQGSVAEVKFDLRRNDGSSIPVIMNAVSRQHGGLLYHELALFVAEDRHKYERELILARKRSEDLFNQRLEAHRSIAELERRQRAAAEDRALFAEQLIGIVSHDLRNPLAAIKVAGEMLLRDANEDARQQRVLGHIQRAADRATSLIGDLLDFTSARIGKGIAINSTLINLRHVIADTLSEHKLTFPERRFIDRFHGEEKILADPGRLTQLLGNLLGNAAAYGDSEQPITISAEVDGDGAVIAVHNHGKPIPAEALPTLFDAMTRGDGGPNDRSVGLGLFIVREIAAAHGGWVEVSSSAEEGTTFEVHLPKN